MDRTCWARSARLDQHTTGCPNCGADLAASGRPPVDLRRAGHPLGSVIGPLAVWLTRRHRDPFIDQAAARR